MVEHRIDGMTYTSLTYDCVYVSLSVLLLALIHRWWATTQAGGRRPPSPMSFSIVGNLFAIPPGLEHIAYMKLGKQLNSDIISLKLFGYDFIVLNSFRAAADMLDKRSSVYSDRLNTPMVQDPTLLDWSSNSALLRYGDLWRSHRRMMNNWLNARAVIQFHPIQEQHIQPLLRRLACIVDDPHPFEKIKDSLFTNTASSMLQLAYGYTLQGDDDLVFRGLRQSSEHYSGGNVYKLPCQCVPSFVLCSALASWRQLEKDRVQVEAIKGAGSIRTVRMDKSSDCTYETSVASGTAEPSIWVRFYKARTSHLQEDEKERNLKEVAQAIVTGGTETVKVLSIIEVQKLTGMKSAQTSTALVAFVAAMVLNPDVQLKAQKELDTVLGPTSLPTMSDRERLPYMRKLIQEVLRWQPVAPTGVQLFIIFKCHKIISHEWLHISAIPHACWRDDNYEGYNIRKGTVVIGNVWAITRDEKIYKDPEAFNPDRFQDPDVPHAPAFGWGRRKCPGVYFAEASLFITIASLLATFTFSKKKGPDGREIIPKIENISNAIVTELKPFDFELKLRSLDHGQLISE
ncbi:cytochrome P450 family protein [Rhizoctonia solani]|uniref:Cytochrome P450 family protein n=1 Tax=Rhizoctonia solani TaxID=456999 RepID=A0A8H8P415_9AGAM|nr:cytochrome P450 family protein [Rhizoctonia solani]QRW23947.1 cytochrome P450 family protein [Rhizoctonia solani]